MNWIKLGAGLLAAALSLGTAAQDFPKAPVKIVIPFPPGGPTDTVGRLLAVKLQETWGQPVVIDYKPGAGTVIGAVLQSMRPRVSSTDMNSRSP